jgi:TatA/E family protein of Tat protein translocase
MAGLTPAHLLIILVIALIVIGPGKLPEVGAALGKSLKEFQKAVGPVQDAVSGTLTPPSQAAAIPPPAQPYYPAQPAAQYQPVMGAVEPAPAQPAPISHPQPDATSQPPSSSQAS